MANNKTSIQKDKIGTQTDRLPVHMTNDIILPGVYKDYITPFNLPDQELVRTGGKFLMLSAEDASKPGGPKNHFAYGTICQIEKVISEDGQPIKFRVHGQERAKIYDITKGNLGITARVLPVTPSPDQSRELVNTLKDVINAYEEQEDPKVAKKNADLLRRSTTCPSHVADMLTAFMDWLSLEDKQQLLSTLDPMERLQFIDESITDQTLEEDAEPASPAAQKKEAAVEKLARQIKEADMPDDIREICESELEDLRTLEGQEAKKTQKYLEQMMKLPWNKSSDAQIDLKQAQEILDSDHYGLDKVKERIMEYLAVQKRARGKGKPTILAFYGPPGVGKTSLGASIAKSMGRKYVRLALGGVEDEVAIRGHSRTYLGSLPGLIVQQMQKAGMNNPVFLLDEVDKISKKQGGGVAAALLELLDPEQNKEFMDHYVQAPIDMSKVVFLVSANELDPIPAPLRDRMEIIEIEGYTDEEKMEIAKRYLIPKAMEAQGNLKPSEFSIDDAALAQLIDGYTREAGVRVLEQQINNLARKAALALEEKAATGVKITAKNLEEYAGVPTVTHKTIEDKPRVGRVNALYVSGMGGGMMPMEAVKYRDAKNAGGYIATGSLEEVMKQSVSDAFDYVRSHAAELGIPEDFYQNYTLHIKAGDGGTPKDGPSAGLAISTLIISTLTGIPIRNDVAMTGEVSITGQSMPIGGVRQKLMGAHRAGVKTVLVPIANKKDVKDLPKQVEKELEIVYVENMAQVMEHALVRMPEPLAPAASVEVTNNNPLQALQTLLNMPKSQLDALGMLGTLVQQFSAAAQPSVEAMVPANDTKPARRRAHATAHSL